MDSNKKREFYYIGESTPVKVDELERGTVNLLREKGDAEAKAYVILEGFKDPQELHWKTYIDLAQTKEGNQLWGLYTERYDNGQWNRIGMECPFENHIFNHFDILRFVDPIDNEPVKTMPAEFDPPNNEETTSKMGVFVLVKGRPGFEDYLVSLEHYGSWFNGMFIDKLAKQMRIMRNMYCETIYERQKERSHFVVSYRD